MGISVMIMGASGRGKSSSIEKLDPKTTIVIKVVNKPFPFKSTEWKAWDFDKKEGSYLCTDDYEMIKAVIKSAKDRGKTKVIIDDMQYLMANEFMRSSDERGFDKFTRIAKDMWQLVMCANEDASEDVRVYFMTHTETSEATGETKAKTIGKLLDEKITLEGLFTIVLKADKNDSGYFFTTKNSGKDVVKSPKGMFDNDKVENDLGLVDGIICDYYGIANTTTTKK